LIIAVDFKIACLNLYQQPFETIKVSHKGQGKGGLKR
jgi:hypothetical protein